MPREWVSVASLFDNEKWPDGVLSDCWVKQLIDSVEYPAKSSARRWVHHILMDRWIESDFDYQVSDENQDDENGGGNNDQKKKYLTLPEEFKYIPLVLIKITKEAFDVLSRNGVTAPQMKVFNSFINDLSEFAHHNEADGQVEDRSDRKKYNFAAAAILSSLTALALNISAKLEGLDASSLDEVQLEFSSQCWLNCLTSHIEQLQEKKRVDPVLDRMLHLPFDGNDGIENSDLWVRWSSHFLLTSKRTIESSEMQFALLNLDHMLQAILRTLETLAREKAVTLDNAKGLYRRYMSLQNASQEMVQKICEPAQ